MYGSSSSRLRLLPFCSILLIGPLAMPWLAEAWSSSGHQRITAEALDSLVIEGLQWSAAEQAAIVSASVQPDLMRSRELPELRAVEAPQHFIDLELLEGKALPGQRWRYIDLLRQMATAQHGILRAGGDVTQVGTVPYALLEGTQRLAAILAQVRLRPNNPGLRSLAAQQVGFLAHYAQDMCQPLHTTVHHDGRAREDGSSPRTGLHRQIDALVRWVPVFDRQKEDRSPRLLEPLFGAIIEALHESHSEVDRVYSLTRELETLETTGQADPELIVFASDRYERAVGLTADLIFTAWRLSAAVEVPTWAREAKPSAGHSE